MAVVLENIPANFDLSKNLMQVKATSNTNLVTTPGVAYAIEIFEASGSLLVGGTMVFEWETDSVTFTVASVLTPDPTNTLIREKTGGESWLDYFSYLKTRFQSNVKFNDNYSFSIDFSGPGALIVLAKEATYEFVLQRTVFTNMKLAYAENQSYVEEIRLGDTMYIQLKVEVSASNTDSTYTEVATKTQELINGSADFYIQELVNPYLEYYIPIFSLVTAFQVLSSYKMVRLSLYERFGSPLENYSELPVDSFYVLKAGWPKIDFQNIDRSVYGAIEGYYDYNKLFLTRAPRTKKTTVNCKEYLFFLFYNPATDFAIRLKVVATYEGNNIVTSYVFSRTPEEKSIYCYPVNSSLLGIALTSGSNKLLKYTVNLDQNGTEVSEIFTYKYDYDSYIAENMYLFTNSDSGVDTFRFTGKLEESTDFDFESARKLLNYPYDITKGEYFDNKIFKIKKFKQSSGFITKEESKWLDELLLAERKFFIGESSNIPIVITSKTKPVYSSQQNLYSFDFEYFVAFEDVVVDINSSLSFKPIPE